MSDNTLKPFFAESDGVKVWVYPAIDLEDNPVPYNGHVYVENGAVCFDPPIVGKMIDKRLKQSYYVSIKYDS